MFSLSLKPGDTLTFLKILLILHLWVWSLFIDLINDILTTFHHLRKRKVYICSNYCHIKIQVEKQIFYFLSRHLSFVFSYVASELSLFWTGFKLCLCLTLCCVLLTLE